MRWLLIPLLLAACSEPDPYLPLPPGGDPTAGDPSTGDPSAGDPTPGDPMPADMSAHLLYINQRVFREDDAFAQGGIARLEIYPPEAPPEDTRPSWTNGDGERCTYESGTEYPESYNGTTWPSGPFQDADDLTLTASGAPGPVVYTYYDSYYLRDSPGPVVQGSFTHNFFFPPEYIPHGASATVSAAGGADVGAFAIDGLELAADYTVSSPNMVSGSTVVSPDSAFTFTWSPGSPGDAMAVIIKDTFSFIKCVFEDDGEATVPAAAMDMLIGGQFTSFYVQTWRERRSHHSVVASDGKVIDVEFVSRHVQIGRFASQ